MQDSWEIDVDWQSLEDGEPEEAACFAEIGMRSYGVPLTQGHDKLLNSLKQAPLFPATTWLCGSHRTGGACAGSLGANRPPGLWRIAWRASSMATYRHTWTSPPMAGLSWSTPGRRWPDLARLFATSLLQRPPR